jgi:hypothetical protein
MRLKILSSLVLLIGLPAVSRADTFSFALKRSASAWECSASTRSTTQAIQVSVSVPTDVTSAEAVKLTAVVDLASGGPLQGSLVKIEDPEGNIWRFAPTTTEAKATKVVVTGNVDNAKVECTFEPPASPPSPPSPQSGATLTQEDFSAAQWLDENDAQLAAIRLRVQRQNPKWPADRIVLLPHLPSGAKAASYPASISERDLAQVVMVVPDVVGVGTGASLTWSLTRCVSVPNYRVQGDFAALAAGQAAVEARREYKLIRVGHVMSCGADALQYSLLISSGADTSKDPIVATLPVRPVYHVGATAMFGFDMTEQSSYVLRDGKIDEVIDRVGPGLLVGATYFVKGVDYGDMRWYNHYLNPFVVFSLEAPKERFVIGSALTYRGGISLGLGLAFNHVPVLASGYTPGQAFAGPGDIPQDKKWVRGFYIGIGVDDKLFTAVRKLTKNGTGGGTNPGSAEQAQAAEKKTAEEEKKKADEAAKKKE